MNTKRNLGILAILALAAWGVFVLTQDKDLAPPESQRYTGAIQEVYEEDGKRFIQFIHLGILTGKKAAIRQLQVEVCAPKEGWTQEQVIEGINKLQGTEAEIDAALYTVPGMGDCGENGWWITQNDDPSESTFDYEVELTGPAVMAYDRGPEELGGFGPHKKIEFQLPVTIDGRTVMVDTIGYEVSWEVFKKVAESPDNNELVFEIFMQQEKVVSIREIYRP